MPTIREESSRQRGESARAKWWRMHVVKLSIEDLARSSGYSPRAISYFEEGVTSKGKRIPGVAWRRYKLACYAVTVFSNGGQIARFAWNWGQ